MFVSNLKANLLVAIVIVLSASVLILNVGNEQSDLSHQIYFFSSLASMTFLAGVIVIMSSGFQRGIKRTYFSFWIAIGVFHLGLAWAEWFGEINYYLERYLSRWYNSEYTVSSYIQVTVFLLGYLVANFFERKEEKEKAGEPISPAAVYKCLLYMFGALAFFWVLVIYFLYGIRDYTSYLGSSGGLVYYLSVFGNSIIGFLFVFLSTSKATASKALIIYLAWASIAFPMGLRGEVLFPLLMSVPFISQNVIKITFGRGVLIAALVLVASSYVFANRHANESKEGYEIGISSVIAELGGSIRPLYEVNKWINEGTVDFYYGATYWAPFERSFLKVFPLIDRPDAVDDMRLMNVAIMERSGPYGFSVIAEAYVNFGYYGTFIVGLALGFFFVVYDSKYLSARLNVLYIIIAYALFFHVRQSFVGTFFNFAILSMLYPFIMIVLPRVTSAGNIKRE